MSQTRESRGPSAGQETADERLERYLARRIAEIRSGTPTDDAVVPLDELKARVDQRARRHQRSG